MSNSESTKYLGMSSGTPLPTTTLSKCFSALIAVLWS